jgi:hypothetical protein
MEENENADQTKHNLKNYFSREERFLCDDTFQMETGDPMNQ